MSRKPNARPHAQIRQSQLVTSFGPGAMVDLPHHAVVIGGLEEWSPNRERVREERLVAKLLPILKVSKLELHAPPIDVDDPTQPRGGIRAWLFPEWFVVQHEETREDGRRSRRLVHRRELVSGKYRGDDKKRHPVVPVRFVQACPNGHLSDIDWHAFVHGKGNSCRLSLSLDERGTTGDFTDVFVRCNCGRQRSLADMTIRGGDAPPLGFCNGERPWLGRHAKEACVSASAGAMPNRLLVRSASNAWFAQTLSVISIPDVDEALRSAVNEVWEDFLQYADRSEDIARERKKAKVHHALEKFPDDVIVWAEVQRRRSGVLPVAKSIKQAELEMLLSSPEDAGMGAPDAPFHARRVKRSDDSPFASIVDRVVRVDRLREVVAQLGFTRFESFSPDKDGELDVDVRRASLAHEVSWLPAVENRGEGVFIAIRPEAMQAWLEREAVKRRGNALAAAFDSWKKQLPGSKATFPGLPYILLHTLSHLLITSVSLTSGYAASSIRERVYAIDGVGYGILLLTGSPDAEGTLGGLVQIAGRIDEHLAEAIELGRLCSNDPVCAEHRPDDEHEERFLHGAACHGCVLIAEPSCERRNELLDRALVVETVAEPGAELFADKATPA